MDEYSLALLLLKKLIADAGWGVMDRPPECPTSQRGRLASAQKNGGRASHGGNEQVEMIEASLLMAFKKFRVFIHHIN